MYGKKVLLDICIVLGFCYNSLFLARFFTSRPKFKAIPFLAAMMATGSQTAGHPATGPVIKRMF